MRKLISIKQVIENAKEYDINLSDLAVDADEIVGLEDLDSDNEDPSSDDEE